MIDQTGKPERADGLDTPENLPIPHEEECARYMVGMLSMRQIEVTEENVGIMRTIMDKIYSDDGYPSLMTDLDPEADVIHELFHRYNTLVNQESTAALENFDLL